MEKQLVIRNDREYEYFGYEIDPIVGNPGTVLTGVYHWFNSTEGWSPILLSDEEARKLHIKPFKHPNT